MDVSISYDSGIRNNLKMDWVDIQNEGKEGGVLTSSNPA